MKTRTEDTTEDNGYIPVETNMQKNATAEHHAIMKLKPMCPDALLLGMILGG